MQPAFRPVIIVLAALLAHFAVGCGRFSHPVGVRSEFYATSPEALYSLIQISRLQRILAFAPSAALNEAFPDIDWSPASVVTPETAERMWAHIRGPDWRPEMLRLLNLTVTPNHSAGVLAVDEQGNVASILHTCNCIRIHVTPRELTGGVPFRLRAYVEGY